MYRLEDSTVRISVRENDTTSPVDAMAVARDQVDGQWGLCRRAFADALARGRLLVLTGAGHFQARPIVLT